MERHWLARPALTVLLLGCAISVMASGRLTLRLILPALLYAVFVPLLQMLSLAVVERTMPWRHAVELFFRGHAPWSVWILASAALWGLVPARELFRFAGPWKWTALVPAALSAVIDYRFFRKTAATRPLLRLTIQRAICWGPGLALFVAPAGWQAIAGVLGL
jgi:hypothetical protein